MGTIEIPLPPEARQGVVSIVKGFEFLTKDGRIHRWTIDHSLPIRHSGWLAARGKGAPKKALKEQTSIQQHAIAHTAAVRVLVGDQPINSPPVAKRLLSQLQEQRTLYAAAARYELPEHRDRVLELFDSAISELASRAEP